MHIHTGNTTISIPKEYQEEYKLGITKSKERNGKILERLKIHKKANRLPILLVVKYHKHVKVLMKMINKEKKLLKGINIDWVHHKREDRAEVVKKFKEGDIDILVGTYILKRGKNFPLMRALVNAGGGDSYENVLQILGRATRTHESKDGTWLDDFYDEGFYLKKHSKHRVIAYKNEKLSITEHWKE